MGEKVKQNEDVNVKMRVSVNFSENNPLSFRLE
jgi:hypothetical protein